MPNYKRMYTTLFNAVTDAVELLKEAQYKCEELYLQGGEDFETSFEEIKKDRTGET